MRARMSSSTRHSDIAHGSLASTEPFGPAASHRAIAAAALALCAAANVGERATSAATSSVRPSARAYLCVWELVAVGIPNYLRGS